jgi:hypothetical protein
LRGFIIGRLRQVIRLSAAPEHHDLVMIPEKVSG